VFDESNPHFLVGQCMGKYAEACIRTLLWNIIKLNQRTTYVN